ncbi:rRNA methyltransferase 3, mitochondrial isoform X1 [Hyperolius riggenbachi]|uniref:rRNA methyltransferase 3, mitochondrial isoform X1 n=2 Tax=Hyperolius riggenbachi TaxID=752182 RepID=UPI0035A3BF3F
MAALMRSVLSCSRLVGARVSVNVQVTRHVRALRRRPVRVIPPESERREQKEESRPQARSAHPLQETQIQQKAADHIPRKQELKIDKAKAGDKRLSKVVTIAKSKNFRDRHGLVLLEGRRLLVDAMEAGAVLQTMFFSRVDQLKDLPSDKLQNAELIKVKFEDIKLWSDVVTPQGIMGIFKRPDHVKMKYPESQLKNTLPLSLICDNIRDPGNLGTILRSAAGAGCNKVLLTKGCVDAWEPKVIRAGMGAHFRLPIITSLEWDILFNYLSEDTKVFVADHALLETSKEKVIKQDWMSSKKVSYVEGEDYYSSSDDEVDELLDLPNVPIQNYHEQWAKGPSALVIGGETKGLSLESLLLTGKSGGRRLYIPVVPGVESLNSAMAASILLFEGKRQLELRNS